MFKFRKAKKQSTVSIEELENNLARAEKLNASMLTMSTRFTAGAEHNMAKTREMIRRA